MANTYRLLPN